MSKSDFETGVTSVFAKLVLIAILIILLSSLGGGLIQLVGNLLGLDYSSIINSISKTSPYAEKDFLRLGVIIGQLCTFTIPAILFCWMVYKKKSSSALLISKVPSLPAIGWTLLVILSCFPLVQWLFWLNKQVSLPTWAIEQEAIVNNTIFSLLSVAQPHELFLNIVAIGILPAIGEELVFRGILQQQLEQVWKKPAIAILGSAFIFSFIHLQFQGFLPRFFLGIILGSIFFWAKNLWIPILAHFIYNTSQILIQHSYYTEQQGVINLENLEQVPIPMTLIAFIVFLFGVWFFPKN